MSATKPIPFEGVLNCWNDAHDFPDLLLAVCRSQKTGRLRFSNPEADKTLYVKDGRVVFAESTSDDDALGHYLLRIGKLSLESYARVSKLVEPGKRLGALLVAEGVLEPKELVPAVVGQVRAIILGLFRRTESWYGFKEEDLPRKEAITLDMPVAELILEGIQYVDSWRRISKGVGDFDRVHRLVDSEDAEWSRLKVEPAVSELVSILKKPASVAEACARSRLSDFEACRYIWAFRSLGWIEAAEATTVPPAASDAGGDDDEESLAIAAAAAADLATTVAGSPGAKSSIPERLIQTRVSVKPPDARRKAPPPPPAPRPVPDDLVRTQLVVDAPAPSPPPATPRPKPQATTLPGVSIEPKPLPDHLVHTQLDLQTPSKSERGGATPSAPSTADMMESILSDSDPVASPSGPEPPSSNASTQFFSGPTAFDAEPAVETSRGAPDADAFSLPEESYDDFLRGELASGFDSLSLDAPPPPSTPEAPITKPEVPQPLPDEAQLTMASFEDLALSDPMVETVEAPAAAESEPPGVDNADAPAPEGDAGLPVLEGEIVTAESVAPQPSGMEFLIGDDPLASPAAEAAPPASFSTDDLLTRREEPVAAALPKRPRKQEMDFDMEGFGHVLGRDE